MRDEELSSYLHQELLGRLSRRDLMRRAGLSGAVLLAPGLLSACGSEDAGGGAGDGDTLRIGYVTPSTGPLAGFAEADEFILTGVREVFSDGLETRKGSRDIEILVKDSQSSPDRAGTAANELITQDGVDLMVVASTPETCNPVSDQCEINQVPCISTVAPWQSWFVAREGDPENPFTSTFHFFWGVEDLIAVYNDMWAQVPNNQRVGGLWPNDSDGNALSDPELGIPSGIEGYTVVDPGRYENATNDFTAQISRFKSGSCEILTGAPIPPDFTNFYQQAAQQGYRPKIASVAKAILFPSAVEALGELGEGLSTEVWWSPNHPFTSSLTGDSSQQLADAFTEETGNQWTQPIGFVHALFEVAKDVLEKAPDPKDKAGVAQTIAKTKLDTIVGPVDWTSGPVPNVSKTPLVGGQWRSEGDGYDLTIVANANAPRIPAADELQAIS